MVSSATSANEALVTRRPCCAVVILLFPVAVDSQQVCHQNALPRTCCHIVE